MSSLKGIVESYMRKVSGLREHCERCLRTERWGGSVVLIVVDAASTSIGLSYFTAVVPKVEEFSKICRGLEGKNLEDLARADIDGLREVWRNRRSWIIAKNIASYLSTLSEDDRLALRTWAGNSKLERWREALLEELKELA
jgi:hypothetical protein